MVRKIVVMLMVAVPLVMLAQKSSDADVQKITEIEQKLAAIDNFNSPAMTELMQKHLYDGKTVQIGYFGRINRMNKSEVVDMTKKPDPTDPDARGTSKVSDMQVDVMGDTGLASYKLANTDTGHKEAALNGDYSLSCLDTFVKRKGQWYAVGTACVPAMPLSQMQWDAVMKMRSMEKQ